MVIWFEFIGSDRTHFVSHSCQLEKNLKKKTYHVSSERYKESGKGELVDPGLNHCEESRTAVHSLAKNYSKDFIGRNFEELLRRKLRLSWGSVYGSYRSNIVLGGVTWTLCPYYMQCCGTVTIFTVPVSSSMGPLFSNSFRHFSPLSTVS